MNSSPVGTVAAEYGRARSDDFLIGMKDMVHVSVELAYVGEEASSRLGSFLDGKARSCAPQRSNGENAHDDHLPAAARLIPSAAEDGRGSKKNCLGLGIIRQDFITGRRLFCLGVLLLRDLGFVAPFLVLFLLLGDFSLAFSV